MNRHRLVVAFLCAALSPGLRAADYMVGADLSFLAQAEAQGVVFKDNGVPTPGLQLFKNHGYNWIRLRLFNNPTPTGRGALPNNLEYTIKLAQESRKLGYKFLLDFHYSDTWADPGKQFTPAAWANMTHEERVSALRDYTRDTLLAFHKAEAFPEMVQIGNEIPNGMLWPDGQLYGQGRTGDNAAGREAWQRFANYLKAGAEGVTQGTPAGARKPLVMIHIDKGGDKAATKFFFDRVQELGVPYDIMGQSFYPWWHGSLLDLRENLHFMATTYKKDIVLVEVAYNWRPAGEAYARTPGPFPESPEGQKAFLEAVHQLVLQTPDNRGKGIFWWEPAVNPRTGIASRGMFDNDANALPVITTFDAYTRGKPPPAARGSGRGPGTNPARGRGGLAPPPTAPATSTTSPGSP
jgi:arabinogalactan endo-1,4-beta-galactosidase